jgi:hypothetical protein
MKGSGQPQIGVWVSRPFTFSGDVLTRKKKEANKVAFEMARVQEEIWPQAGGAITVLGAEMLAGVFDTKHPNNFPTFQSMVTGVAIVGSLAGIGFNKARKFCTGALWGVGIGILLNLVKYIYNAVTKSTVRARLSDIGALVAPRVVGSLAAGDKKALKEGQGLKVTIGSEIQVAGKEKVGVGGGLEF